MSEKPEKLLIPVVLDSDASYCIPDAHGHCITCSDEAVTVTVLSVNEEGGMASVQVQEATGEVTEEVDITLIDAVVPGDMLLVHGGVAIGRIGELDEAGSQ